MHEQPQSVAAPKGHRGPEPSVYVIIRIVGCRIHWRTVAESWSPVLSAYVLFFLSSRREEAYQAAQGVNGLLLRYTADEFNHAVNAWRQSVSAVELTDMEERP